MINNIDIDESELILLFEHLNRRYISYDILDAMDLIDFFKKKIKNCALQAKIDIYCQIINILNTYQTTRIKKPIDITHFPFETEDPMSLLSTILLNNYFDYDKNIIAYKYQYENFEKARINNTEDLILLYECFTMLIEDEEIKRIRNSIFSSQNYINYLFNL